MNSTDLNTTNPFTQQAVMNYSTLWPTAVPKEKVVFINAETTALPVRDQNTIIGVIVFAMVLTLIGIAFILYRYMCSNKGDYLTTGEPVPGDYFYDESNDPDASEKKEYFI